MTNFDENDHLAVDFFMTRGRLLYKDIFSHHFPLPYYWTYLFTPFWSSTLPARTITFFRLSTMVMYLLNFIFVFLFFKNKFTKIAYSVWIFFLATFFTLYHGNLVLSETYSAIFISSLFWLTVPIILKWEKPTRYQTFLTIIISSAAFWTQPLLIELSLLPLLFSHQKVKTFCQTVFFNLLPIIFFFFNGQLAAFWQQGIWFNFFIYPKFFVDNLPAGNRYLQVILYFFHNEFFMFTHFGNPTQVFQFILHLFFWLFVIKILSTKNIKNIFIFFLFFLSVHVREVKIIPGQIFNFGIYPFLLVASSSLVLLLFFIRHWLAIIIFILTLGVSLSDSRPVLIQSLHPGYNYEVFWSYRQRTAEIIQKLTLPSEKILIYPHDVDYYALSSRLPPDRFVYWFPWIDSVPEYRQERLTALNRSPVPLIYIGNLDYQGIPNFYRRFFPDLTKNYTPVVVNQKTTGLWLRNDLLSRLKLL